MRSASRWPSWKRRAAISYIPAVFALERVMQSWRLPLRSETENSVLIALTKLGTSYGLSAGDFSLVLERETESWGKSGVDTVWLRAAISTALETSVMSGSAYFLAYRRLRAGATGMVGLSHTVAQRLLSRAPLISSLLSAEKFSCSQVARVINATEPLLGVSHVAISVIARELKMLPALDPTAAGEELWDDDQAFAAFLFSDSPLEEVSEIAAGELGEWFSAVDVGPLLEEVGGMKGQDPFWPYLQMLHWCLTPVEFYDHPASFLYEFAPRGAVGLRLFGRYPVPTGNPILNNAKAVESLNASWARSRSSDAAMALVSLLGLLEETPFVSRRHAARVLRAWLVRNIELRTSQTTEIAVPVSGDSLSKSAYAVGKGNTGTQGVIEQRVVDALAVLAFQGPGWRAHGVGDSVNASNLSRKKLGDVEFVNVDARMAIAIEAHGGLLSRAYAAEHQRSLARSIEQRLSESWAALDAPEAWTVKVVFVAHSWATDALPHSETVAGVAVVYELLGYDALLSKALARSSEAERAKAFESHVLSALNRATVRDSTREIFKGILST